MSDLSQDYLLQEKELRRKHGAEMKQLEEEKVASE